MCSSAISFSEEKKTKSGYILQIDNAWSKILNVPYAYLTTMVTTYVLRNDGYNCNKQMVRNAFYWAYAWLAFFIGLTYSSPPSK